MIEYRPIEAEELRPFLQTVVAAFSEARIEDDEFEHERRWMEADRYFAAIEDGAIVGGAGAYSLRTIVPGGADVGTAGITVVGVLPTHRRRGILRELMGRLLRQARDRGEPLSTLFASQAAIYGRFGYGLASSGAVLDVLVPRAAFVPTYEPHGGTRLLARADALPAMKRVYDDACRTRPGMVLVDDDRFDLIHEERDKPDHRYLYAVHVDDEGEPDAYAVYRGIHEWPDSMPHLELRVRTLVGRTPQGIADVWRFLLDVDLVHKVTTMGQNDQPVDTPLRWLLQEPRAMRMRVVDSLHARPVDLAAALAGRGYAGDGRVVLAVADPFLEPSRTVLEVTVEGGRPVVTGSDAEPDLECDTSSVGAVFLGGATWRNLAAGGRVRGSAEALARADALFASDPAPWAPFSF